MCRRIPPEYADHHQTWMAYPWDVRIWGRNLAAAQRTITHLIKMIAIYERVCLLVPPSMEIILARKLKLPEVEIIPARYNDIWVRDTLPTFAWYALIDRLLRSIGISTVGANPGGYLTSMT